MAARKLHNTHAQPPASRGTLASLRIGRSWRPASRGTRTSLRIGIDLGGTKTEGIVMDTQDQILLRERRPTPREQGYEAILDNMLDLVLELERQAGVPCTVGIGTPGAISTRTGMLKNSNTTCLNGRPVKTDLEARLQRVIRMTNDANCFALSEALDGAGRGRPVVFGIIMGTGVGGGIVVNGQVLDGLQHIAGEWGHNVLEPEGPPCYCGKRGCVETLISGPGFARDYQLNGGEPDVAAHDILARAQAGDAIAEAAIQRFLDRFGRALAVVINILDPHAVVLGGGLSNIARLYTEGPQHLARHIFNDELCTPILRNAFGDSSGVRGAAQLWRADEA
jgi:fructokinase